MELKIFTSMHSHSIDEDMKSIVHIFCNNRYHRILDEVQTMCDRLPSSNYEAKKIVNDLGLHYEKIDACNKDCALYYKKYLEATQSPVCKLSSW